MSSILDALRKLEQEKSVRDRTDDPVSVRELALEPEFDGDGERGGKSSMMKTAFLALTGLLLLAGIGAGLVAAGTIVVRRDAPVQKTAAATAASAEVTTTVAPVRVAANPPKPASAAPTSSAAAASAAPAKPASPKETVPAPPAKPAPVQAVAKPAPAPPAVPVAVPAKETPTSPAAVEDIEKQPILSEAVRVRLGLPPLKINIVGIPNNRNPRASALINMQKVYVGETVPGTSARLMDVNLRGVSLDINGQRYFLSRR